MNRYSKNTLVWGTISLIYFLAMCESIHQGYSGWISILFFVPFVCAGVFTAINFPKADIFIWNEDEVNE